MEYNNNIVDKFLDVCFADANILSVNIRMHAMLTANQEAQLKGEPLVYNEEDFNQLRHDFHTVMNSWIQKEEAALDSQPTITTLRPGFNGTGSGGTAV